MAYEAFIAGIPYAQASYVADPVRYGAAATAVPYVRRTRKPVEDIRGFIRQHKRELDSIDVVIRKGKETLWKKLETQVEDIYVTSSVPQLLEISYNIWQPLETGTMTAGCCGLPGSAWQWPTPFPGVWPRRTGSQDPMMRMVWLRNWNGCWQSSSRPFRRCTPGCLQPCPADLPEVPGSAPGNGNPPGTVLPDGTASQCRRHSSPDGLPRSPAHASG